MEKKFKLGVIGCGFMASAIIKGILKAKVLNSEDIIVSNKEGFGFETVDTAPEGYRLAASSYTIVDMEQDGTFEAVLLLTLNAGTDYGRLVLRQDGSGTVYGYTLGSRELMDLKADGTYSYSYGASSNGFGQMIFSDTDISGTICHDWATVPISCMDTVTDADGTTHTDYYWGSQPISQGVYEDTLAAQQSKEDVSWQSLSGLQT